jgi:hypothetical protein
MAVQTFLDASTDHITTFDKTLLCGREHKFPTRVIPHNHGWWVNVPDKKELAEYLVLMCMAGFSISFVRLLVAASDCDCWWINLDTDGDMSEALEIHKDSAHDRDEERALAAIEENKARASRAEIALKAYDAATDELGTLNDEHVIDLVTDIQHYLRFNSCSFIEPIQSARNHFHAEIAEEFFGQEQSHRDNYVRYDKDEIIIVADQKKPGVTSGQIKIHQGIPEYGENEFLENSKLFEHGNLDIFIAIKPHIPTKINNADEVSAYLVDLLTPLVIQGTEIEIQVVERTL